MFQRALRDLRGDDVMIDDGRIGALEDVYFDAEWGEVRYLLVSTGEAEGGLHRVVPAHSLPGWFPDSPDAEGLEQAGICSGSDIVGFRLASREGPAGWVADLLVDDDSWSIEYMVVQLDAPDAPGERVVPLTWVRGIDKEQRVVTVGCSAGELRGAPVL